MDGFDIFKKLVTGTKFDKKRFYDDAVRFHLVKPKQELDETAEESSQVINGDDVDVDKKMSKKRKAEDEQGDGEEEQQVQLFSTAPSTSPKAKKKKKKNAKQSRGKLLALEEEQTNHIRKQNRIYVSGTDIPPPFESFEQLRSDYAMHPKLIENIQSSGYTKPTPIQMQAIPVMLTEREVLSCAPTGSGKTAAFLIPVLHHLKKPRNLGFRAVIVTPTRELARQTYLECRRLSENLGFRVHMIDKTSKAEKKFGAGSSMKFDVLITTPNRLVYLIGHDPPVIFLENVEWLIVDESDKLFESGKQGFRDQLATIYKACTSPRIRHAMFSATFAFEVEEWCKLNLDNVVTVSVGIRNTATELVQQELVYVGNELGKLVAFRDLVKKGLKPPVLVFVQTKDRAKELFSEMIYDGINVDVIHSDRTELQRDNVVRGFRCGKIWVLICTELMGRGIDFIGVNLVVNYDFPPSIISYIHRIGRTGRAGRSGRAVTFFTDDDRVNLRSIAQVMKDSGCQVPQYMLELKKPKKEEKRKLAKRGIKRQSLSTFTTVNVKRKRKSEGKKKKSVTLNASNVKNRTLVKK